jgi:hypothetical protein
MRGDEDDDAILHDGQRVRVLMMMKDSTDGMHKHPALHDGRGGKPGRRPGFVLADRVADDQRQAAYSEYENRLTAAWQNDAAPSGAYPYSASDEGRECSVNGAPGTLQREGNWLVCQPIQRKESRADDSLTIDEVYRLYDRDLEAARKVRP